MNLSGAKTLLAVALTAVFVAGCTPSYVTQGNRALKMQNYQQAEAYFEQALKQRPDDPHLQHALGQVYFHLGDYDQAEKLLKAAQTRAPMDGTIILYLGMIAENRKDYAGAAALYNQYLAENGKSNLAPTIRGRLMYVQNERMREQVAMAIKSEKSLATQSVPDKAVGVLPFAVPARAGDDVRALAKGLAAALWYDLSTVKDVQVVERLQLNYVTDELEASSKGFVAKDSGPRIGKIVGAKHLVMGNVDSPANDKLELDGGLINTDAGAYSPTYSANDQFSKAMKVEKQLALAVLDSLGIKLGSGKRHELSKPETDNYKAFLAFGRGIEQFDLGEFGKADVFFTEATHIDPSFQLAKDFHNQAQLLQAGSTDLQRFSGVVLAGVSAPPPVNNRPGNELFEISSPESDPRNQDLPTQTGGSGTVTVSGSVR
jgi:tetratricopeptide (TPR) repeat protein